jgi:hypothetical protein
LLSIAGGAPPSSPPSPSSACRRKAPLNPFLEKLVRRPSEEKEEGKTTPPAGLLRLEAEEGPFLGTTRGAKKASVNCSAAATITTTTISFLVVVDV